MMEITDFNEYYKTISNYELLNILDNPNGYQPLAIEAAKKEFSHRKLSDTEINEARQPSVKKQLQKENQKKQLNAIEEQVRTTGKSLLETINPVQPEVPTTEKTIRLIVIVFSTIFLFEVFTEYDYIIAYLKDFTRYPFTSSWVLFPIILLPISIFKFWKRKSIGWMLLTIYLTFSAGDTIWYLIQEIRRRSSEVGYLDKIFPKTSLLTYIFHIIFYCATIYVLDKKDIRSTFLIKKENVIKVLIMTSTLTFLLHFFV